ncbi:MAG TPA: HEAT repeat domain-containing protein [Methanothrix sp.]|nr:HEAT repeat domain-containing protein [Methanothrix sp.]
MHLLVVFVLILSSVVMYGLAEDVDKWLGDLNDPNPLIRQVAVQNLGESNNTTAIDSITMALNDTDSQVREATVEVLGWKLALDEINNTEAIDSLILALNDTDSQVREAAALALGISNDTGPIVPPKPTGIATNDSATDESTGDRKETQDALKNEHAELAEELEEVTKNLRICIDTSSEDEIASGNCDQWEEAADDIRDEQRRIFKEYMENQRDESEEGPSGGGGGGVDAVPTPD